jgi:putative hydrolase of HD superfamily
MNQARLKKKLSFIESVENLKSTIRTGRSATGRQESTAEHTWRLALMAMVYAEELEGVDPHRLLKMCIIHDLGETLHGDVSAIEKATRPEQGARERVDLLQLLSHLDAASAADILDLYDEYEAGQTQEARATKALDKLETILQHTQGCDQQAVDFSFNLRYGRAYTDHFPALSYVRSLVDEQTLKVIDATARTR